MNRDDEHAVVLLSGGLDSATCLAMARAQGLTCHALTVDYGQRHQAEMQAAARLAVSLGAEQHRVVRVDLAGMGGSALTDAGIDVPEQPGTGVPVTYVPARNTVMLSIALAWAEVLDARHIFIGVNAVDYSGYPDCRPEFIQGFERLADLATKAGDQGSGFTIRTPLQHMSKADIASEAIRLGLDPAWSWSCYDPTEDGLPCGLCDSCRLRQKGFEEAGIIDPTRYATL